MLVSFSFVGILEFAFNKVGNIGNLEAFGAAEDASQRVIFGGWEGVEGMIMAAGATQSHPQEGIARGRDHVIKPVELLVVGISIVDHFDHLAMYVMIDV